MFDHAPDASRRTPIPLVRAGSSTLLSRTVFRLQSGRLGPPCCARRWARAKPRSPQVWAAKRIDSGLGEENSPYVIGLRSHFSEDEQLREWGHYSTNFECAPGEGLIGRVFALKQFEVRVSLENGSAAPRPPKRSLASRAQACRRSGPDLAALAVAP